MTLYEQFEKYCHKLPGKCYPETAGKMATTHGEALHRFVLPFIKKNNAEITITIKNLNNNLYYIVEDVRKKVN